MNDNTDHPRRLTWTIVLMLSVAMNLALAAGVVRWWKASPTEPQTTAVVSAPVIFSATPAGSNISTTINYLTNSFHWRLIESTNYEEYVRNLRNVNCPEKTIRDILLAELKDSYAQRERDLLRAPSFWLAGKERRIADRRVMEERLVLIREKEDLLLRLGFIPDWEEELFKHDRMTSAALLRFLVGPVTDEKFHAVAASLGKHEMREQQIKEISGGIITEDDEAQLAALKEARRSELFAVLSPLELQEAAARIESLEFIFQDRAMIEIAQLSAMEFRQILILKTDRGREFRFPDDESEPKKWGQARINQFTNSVAALLGPERFADFIRSGDKAFMSIHEFAQANQIPKEAAVKVYDLRKAALDEIHSLRADATLDDAARMERVREIEEALQEIVPDVLGQAFDSYLNQGGSWITNANQL